MCPDARACSSQTQEENHLRVWPEDLSVRNGGEELCDVRELNPADRISEGWGSRPNAERRTPLGQACVRGAFASASTVCAIRGFRVVLLFGQRET
jgi:hypothetical protein